MIVTSATGVKILDYMSGLEVNTIIKPAATINAIAFSSDGKKVITGSSDKTVKVWDIETASLVTTLFGHETGVDEVAISPDGQQAISATRNVGGINNSIILWDLKNRRMKFRLSSDMASGLSFTSDGKDAISSYGEFITFWDLSNGKPTENYKIESNSFTGKSFDINRLGFFPMINKKVTINDKQSIKEFIIRQLVNEGNLSNDMKWVAVKDGSIFLYNAETGERLYEIPSRNNWTLKIIFSPDGKNIISGHEDHTIRVWDATNGKEVKKLTGHEGGVYSLAISPDGSKMVSGAKDNSIIVWDLKTFTPLYTAAVNHDGTQWIVFNKDGYWDASPRGGELVAMVKDMDSYNIDQFAVSSNRPDLLLKSSGCTNTELLNHYTNLYKKRLKRLNIKEEQLSSEFHLPSSKIISSKRNDKFVDITFNLSDEKYPIKRYNVFVNDVPIFGAFGKEVNTKNIDLTERIELTSGINKVEVSCVNEKGMESYRAVINEKYDIPMKGNLYFMAFGVSTYSNPSLSLSYAHKDALDLEKLFMEMKGKSFNNVITKVYINEQVTPEAIRSAKEFVKNAKVDDMFILFIAGHGMHDTDPEATYYFLTSNADLKNLKGTAADFETIEDLLQGIPPRSKLFLMDACESGEIDEEEQGQIIAAATGAGITSRGFKTVNQGISEKAQGISGKRAYLYQKDRYIYNDLVRRSGAVVFSSSKGGELSYEKSDLENGVFTEYLIKALSSKLADKNKDKRVSIEELRNYVNEEVARSTSDLQHPTIDRDNIFQNINIEYNVPEVKVDIMNIDMVEVKGGSAIPSDEKKYVTVPSFLIGRYEVTQTLWKEVMGYNPSKFTDSDNCPVDNVTYDEVVKFIAKLNTLTGKKYRLPNEVEWQVAALAGNSSSDFAGTKDQPNDYAWFLRTSNGTTHEVGLKKPNEYGLYDMSGNVFELCNSWKNKKIPIKMYGGCIFSDDKRIWASDYDYIPHWINDKKIVIGFRLAMSIEKKK